ncbi:MAG: peptide-methionine (R)-S-oxide reductase [Nitrococcus sp.]|nr:peptide-methionine (R)-S-oxide reductase [Nitrococcus sp.]
MRRRQFLQGTAAALVAPASLLQARERSYEELKPVEVVRAHWQEYVPSGAQLPSPDDKLTVTQEQWRERLPADRYHILFEGGTEPRYSSKLVQVNRPGVFICAACDLPLFTTPMQFHSGTGWPSFYTYIPGTLETELDFSLIWPRTEYHCVRCGGHQGHRFDNWPVPSGVRYCNNGLALEFLAADGSKA